MLFLLAVGLYAVTFNHSFNMDDELVTNGHSLVSQGVSGIRKILTSPYYEDAMGYSYEYRPVTHISFALEHQFFGGTARSGHVLNALLYGLSCLVMFGLLGRMSPGASLFPMLATLLFATHPMHTEVVASIKNRDEILALLFAMLAMGNAWRFNAEGRWWRLPLVVLLMLLSLLSKSSAAPFLLMIPLSSVMLAFRPSRSLLLMTTSGVALAVYFHLREWQLSWFTLPVGTMFLLLLGLILWKWAKSVEWAKMVREVFPRKWPETSIMAMTHWLPRTRWDAVLIGLTAVALIISLVTAQMAVLAFPLLFILFGPYWTGRHSGSGMILLAVLVLSSFLMVDVEASGYLMLIYLAVVLRDGGRTTRTFLACCAAMFFLCLTAYGLLSDWPATVSLWHRIDLKASPWLILKFISLWPILPLMVIYIYRHKLAEKRALRPLLWVMLALGIQSVVSDFTLDFVLSFIALVALYLHLTDSDDRRSRKLELALALLITISYAFVVLGGDELLAPSPTGHTLQETPMAPRPETAPKIAEVSVSTSLEDRPLTYAEYPLDTEAGLSTRLGTASLVLGHYLTMMVMPWPQSFYYGFDEVRIANMKDPWAITSVAVHLLLLLCAIFFAICRPMLSFGILAYLSSIFLFSNLIGPVAGMIGDRLTYVASFGFCIAVGYLLSWLYEMVVGPRARKVLTMGAILLLVSLSGLTLARSLQWKDALTLMRNDLEHVPNSAQAHNLLASHLMKNSFGPEYAREAMDMRREALGHFKQAVRIWPEFFNAWYDLGRVYQILNEPQNALSCFKEAHRLDSTFYDATLNAAVISDQLGDNVTAIEYYGRCIRFNPEMLEAYNNLSYLYFRSGMYVESIAVNERAISYNPAWRDPYQNIAHTYETMGNVEKTAEFRERLSQLK